jgi:Leucine-rich repeat (LRR) protein
MFAVVRGCLVALAAIVYMVLPTGCVSLPVASPFPNVQLNVLQDLYSSTSGETWAWRPVESGAGEIWSFAKGVAINPCFPVWQGVNCSESCYSLAPSVYKTCTLTSLELARYNLSGALPFSLGNLTGLQELDLAANRLTGSVPSTVGLLTDLVSLNLGALITPSVDELALIDLEVNGNLSSSRPYRRRRLSTARNRYGFQFSSDVSTNYSSQLANVTYANKFSGVIPDVFGQLRRLRYLDLSHNRFSGPVPESVYTLLNLTYINLDNNMLHSSLSRDIGNWANCEVLSILSNRLYGSIPSEIARLSALQFLGLSVNELNGSIPSEIGLLSNLTVLSLEVNRIDGSLAPELGRLTQLQQLLLGVNDLTGSIPVSLGAMQNLNYMGLEVNCLTGTLPSEVCALSRLVLLNVGINFLSGSICSNFNNLSNMKLVDAVDNFFSSTIPQTFFEAQVLINANWAFNYLSGPIPANVGFLPFLSNCTNVPTSFTILAEDEYMAVSAASFLSFSGNFLTQSIPSDITRLSCLSYLLLYGNHLSGPIPSNVGVMRAMTAFVVDRNQLSGTIPPSIVKLTNLKQLTLNNNRLSGPLPANLSSLDRLESFTAESNLLSGSIASDFFQYSKVETFSLYSNRLTSTLPTSLVSATKLKSLLLSNNLLRGDLEVFSDVLIEIGGLNELQSLDLSANQFTGHIPASIFRLPNITSLSLGKNCFKGSIPATVCSMKSIASLNLNGLSSGDSCEIPLIAALKTYTAAYMTGSVPTCLFSAETLHSLDIAGNGLVGSLPDLDNLPPKLENISASHNRITGTLPVAFAAGTLFVLDLRSNELTGTCQQLGSFYSAYRARQNISEVLVTSLDSSPQLSLSENRLSGELPPAFLAATTINVLSGNLFGCRSKTELPARDPYYSEASCGTNFLAATLFLYFVVLIAGCLGLILLWLPHIRGFELVKESFYLLRSNIRRFFEGSDAGLEMQKTQKNIKGDDVEAVDGGHNQNNIFQIISSNASGLSELVQQSVNDVTSKESADRHLNNFVKQRISEVSIAESSYGFRLLDRVRIGAGIMSLLLIVIFLPLYPLLKTVAGSKYSTHEYQYALNPSAAYLTGKLPAGIVCVLICFLSAVIIAAVRYYDDLLRRSIDRLIRVSQTLSWPAIQNVYRGGSDSLVARDLGLLRSTNSLDDIKRISSTLSNFKDPSSSTLSSALRDRYLAIFNEYSFAARNVLFIVVDVLLISVVNGAFVYVILTQSEYAVYFAEFALAFVKIYWNNMVVPLILDRINSNVKEDSSSVWNRRSVRLDIQICLNIFNVLVSPILCLLVDGSNCFLHMFVKNETIENVSVYKSCHITDFTGQCVDVPKSVTSYFTPPFIYTFQCSSQFVRNYVAVFVIMYIFLALVSPLAHLCLAYVVVRAPGDSPVLVDRFRAALSLTEKDLIRSRVPTNKVEPTAKKAKDTSVNPPSAVDATSWRLTAGNLCPSMKVFRYLLARSSQVDRYICKFIVDMTVLLTFGVAYPPLGIIICLSTLCMSSEFHLLLSRCCYLYDNVSALRDEPFPALRCDGVIGLLGRFRWIIIILSCWFFAFFLYDIALGEYSTGLWACLVLLCWPVVLFFGCWGLDLYVGDTSELATAMSASIASVQSLEMVRFCSEGSITASNSSSHLGRSVRLIGLSESSTRSSPDLSIRGATGNSRKDSSNSNLLALSAASTDDAATDSPEGSKVPIDENGRDASPSLNSDFVQDYTTIRNPLMSTNIGSAPSYEIMN